MVVIGGGIVPVSAPPELVSSPVVLSSPELELSPPVLLVSAAVVLLSLAPTSPQSCTPTQNTTSCVTMFMSASTAVTRAVHMPSGTPPRNQLYGGIGSSSSIFASRISSCTASPPNSSVTSADTVTSEAVTLRFGGAVIATTGGPSSTRAPSRGRRSAVEFCCPIMQPWCAHAEVPEIGVHSSPNSTPDML